MDPFERNLNELLARREAPRGLAASVMERVRAEERSAAVVEIPRRWGTPWRWAAVAGVAASLSLAWVVDDARRTDQRAAEQAETELFEALQVAGLKIHQASQRIDGGGAEGEPR